MSSKMKLYWCLELLLFVFIFQIEFVINKILFSSKEPQEFQAYDQVLMTLFNDCNLSLRNIMVFDNDSSSTAAITLSNLQVPVGIKLKSLLEIDGLYLSSIMDPIEIQGLVIVINDESTWVLIRENIALYWELRNTCVIFLVMKTPGACQYSSPLLQVMAQLHFAKTYFICMNDKFTEPVIYTHDPYGDTKPPYWLKIQQQVVNLLDWTLYRRDYEKADTCKGLIFNRTRLTKNTPVMVAVSKEISIGPEVMYTYGGNPRNLNGILMIEDIIKLERLLDMNFTYHVHFFMYNRDNNQRRYYLMTSTPVNVILDDVASGSRKQYRVISYPTYHDNYVILSRDRGPATPLEKIAKYYGIWTLVSLIVVLVLCFLVIWFKTSGRMASAFFDILRLLINSGIATPINTLPLKIFFTMIFVYFIVIQSTFSGQLSKFLTIPEYLRNVNSLDDLTDSSVKTVNTFFYVLDIDHSSTEKIAPKLVHWGNQILCWRAMENTTDGVCIGPYWPFLRTIINRNLTGFHLSKDKLSMMQAYITYRQRFPMIEKFNWALIALIETRLYHREAVAANEMVASKAARMNEQKRQDFRSISFTDIKFALILLIIGNSISFLLFILELSAGRYQKMIKKNKGFLQLIRLKNRSKTYPIRRIQVRPRV